MPTQSICSSPFVSPCTSSSGHCPNVLRATLIHSPTILRLYIVLSELDSAQTARMAFNHVGYPGRMSLYAFDCACSSSLQAVVYIADSIIRERIN